MPEFFFQQAPQYIPVLTDPKDFWVNVVLAVITLLAVLVALFQERIKSFFNRAKLDLQINLAPPDCHKIALTDSVGTFQCNSLYIRIRVLHKRGESAENVEMILANFWNVDAFGEKVKMKEFLPMNLVWSHFQPRTHVVKIPREIFRHCDFGFFAKLNGDGSVALKLDTIVQPNFVAGGKLSNVIQPGKYEFEILISGDNVIPVSKKWRLEFDETWSESEEEMLRQHIKIEEI